METWLPVAGFEDLYLVSDMGRVKSLDRTVIQPARGPTIRKGHVVKGRGELAYRKPGQLITPKRCSKGGKYLACTLYGKQSFKRFYVHRLVATAFVPNPSGKSYVNHKNKDTHDNRAENLEWVTAKENTHHAFRVHPLPPPINPKRGSDCASAKLNERDVIEIRTSWTPGSTKLFADRYGVTVAAIRAVVTGRHWRHISPASALLFQGDR